MIKAKDIPPFNRGRFFYKIKVNKENGCWEFQSKRKIANGVETYCIFTINRKEFLAHRVCYSVFFKLSNDMVLDHICRNKICVYPAHLREVSRTVNSTENSVSPTALNKQKTHCKWGHEFNESNTYNCMLKNGSIGRACILCAKIRKKKYYKLKKGK